MKWLMFWIIRRTDQFQCSEKLVAQTSDRAPVISGSINGLQTLIKEKYSETEALVCIGLLIDLI